MAVTLSSAVLFGASLLFAVCALFWPQIEQAYVQHAGESWASKLTGKCPLGYTGPMPANHPPVMPTANKQSKADGEERPTQPRSSVPGGVAAAELKGPFLHYTNGSIWTANTESPWATSMTVDTATGQIISVDTDSSSSSSSSSSDVGKATEIDLQGAFIMPGFVDPHVHLIPSGLALADVNLRHVSSKQELIQRIADRAAAAAAAAAAGGEGEVPWLLGGGWSEHEWGGDLPDASWIDEVTGDIPAVFLRMDYHMAWVNTAALAAAGLLGPDAHLDEPGIDRDEEGTPTGLLREAAMDIVRKQIPAASVDARKAALATAGSYLLSRGVTSVGDMGWGLFGLPGDTWNDLELVYDWAAENGKLPLRVAPYVPLHSWQRLSERIASKGDHDESQRLFWGGVKEFADGSLGSSSALFWDPYNDSSSGNCGMRPISQAELERLVVSAAGAGLQVAVHAIGDRAFDEVLEVFEQVDACEPRSAAQPCWHHRLEHVQHISGAASAAKMAQLKLLAIPNPQHLISDMEIMLAKLGPERAGAGRSHAYRTMAAMGVSVAFGSDWPVADIHPFESVHIAVHRSALPQQVEESAIESRSSSVPDAEPQLPAVPALGPPKPWAPEERMPLDAVLLSHTAVAAQAIRLDHMVGILQPGFKADFIVLDRSPFEEFKHYEGSAAGGGGFGAGVPKVLRTYLDGRCVFGCETGLPTATSEVVATV